MSRFLSNLLRDSFLAGAAYFFLAVFFVTSAYAGAMPFLLLAGDTMGDADGEVKYFLKFKDTAGKDQEVTYAIGLVGGVTVRDSTIGEIIRDRLNSDARVKDEYEFSIKRRDDGYLQLRETLIYSTRRHRSGWRTR